MNSIKKILILLALVFVANLVNAQSQPPVPPPVPQNDTDHGYSINSDSTPVGTATALLVALGAGYAAYKVRKNTKANEDE